MVAVIQAVFFVWQLRLMRLGVADATLAAQSAKGAADAAREGNEISRANSRAQLRATLVVDQFYWNGNPTGGYQFGAIWRNAGATPSKRLRAYVNYFVGSGPRPATMEFNYTEGRTAGASAGPGAVPFRGSPVPREGTFSLDFLRDVAKKKSHLVIYGWARYFDVFDDTDEHVTKFACTPILTCDPQGAIAFAFEIVGEHNCADEECGD